MSLRNAIEKVLQEYPVKGNAIFTGNPLAVHIRRGLRDAVRAAVGGDAASLTFKGSAGQSDWTDVPWVAIFDPSVTTTATAGYYVVLLFHASKPIVHLSLNQGAWGTRTEFGRAARQVLKDRATIMRRRLADFAAELPAENIELGARSSLPSAYALGHAMGKSYELVTLPDDATLTKDVRTAVRAYRTLIFRGGLDLAPEVNSDIAHEVGPDRAAAMTLLEIRQYRAHRRIDRNPAAAKKAKRYHGLTCQACEFNFEGKYGVIGKGFIEAHHLRPLAELEEGVPVKFDVATDFAVLCSNCHRMIHRTTDPSDLAGFRRRYWSSARVGSPGIGDAPQHVVAVGGFPGNSG